MIILVDPGNWILQGSNLSRHDIWAPMIHLVFRYSPLNEQNLAITHTI
jgi:hypothetical protein